MLSRKPLPNFLTLVLFAGSTFFAGQTFAEHHGDAVEGVKDSIEHSSDKKETMLKADELTPESKLQAEDAAADKKVRDLKSGLAEESEAPLAE